MPNTQELRETRANRWEQMKALNERAATEKRDLSVEEQKAWDELDNELDTLADKIERQEKFENRERDFSSVDRTELRGGKPDDDERAEAAAKDPTASPKYKSAFAEWMKFGASGLDPEDARVLRNGFVDPKDVKNAAGVGTGGAGGYTVPAEFRNAIIERQKMVSSVRRVSETITTTSGANLPWPTADDTGNIGAILAENTAVTEQDVTFGTASLDAYMYTSKLIRVSLQLLQDTGFDIEAWLRKTMATRIARIQNQHFTTGTGTAQPDGLVTGATVGKTGLTGQTTTIIYDDLVDIIDSLDPAYLDGNEQWMFAQSVRKTIRKIKDSQNRPLWEPSLQVGTPDTLLGYGIVLNNDMPTPAANAKSVLFGDFGEAYVVRDVKDFFLVRFAERYMDFLQVGFAGFQRTDGTVQNQYAYTAYQNSAT
jgi:HK97 family phage major capsid protein